VPLACNRRSIVNGITMKLGRAHGASSARSVAQNNNITTLISSSRVDLPLTEDRHPFPATGYARLRTFYVHASGWVMSIDTRHPEVFNRNWKIEENVTGKGTK
jgi:hypothetical protein